MKRDLELFRSILLKIEEANGPISITDLSNNNEEYPLISFHVQLLLDAQYIEAIVFKTLGVRYQDFNIARLTNAGCDYLDAVRNDTIWNKTQEKITSIVGSTSLDVTKAVAIAVAKTMLGI